MDPSSTHFGRRWDVCFGGENAGYTHAAVSIFQWAWTIPAIKEYNSREKDRFYSLVVIIDYIVVALLANALIAVLPIAAPLFLQKGFGAGRSVIPILTLFFYFSAVNTVYGFFIAEEGIVRSLFTTTVVGRYKEQRHEPVMRRYAFPGEKVCNGWVWFSLAPYGMLYLQRLWFCSACFLFLSVGHSGIGGRVFCSILTLILSIIIVYRELRKIKIQKIKE